jgi:hypothetical protein
MSRAKPVREQGIGLRSWLAGSCQSHYRTRGSYHHNAPFQQPLLFPWLASTSQQNDRRLCAAAWGARSWRQLWGANPRLRPARTLRSSNGSILRPRPVVADALEGRPPIWYDWEIETCMVMGAGRSDISPLCARKAAGSHPSVIARPQNLLSLLNLLNSLSSSNLLNLLNLLNLFNLLNLWNSWNSWAKKLTAPLGLPRRSPTLVLTGPCAA